MISYLMNQMTELFISLFVLAETWVETIESPWIKQPGKVFLMGQSAYQSSTLRLVTYADYPHEILSQINHDFMHDSYTYYDIPYDRMVLYNDLNQIIFEI